MAILFYSTKGPYGCFSNFSRDEVTIYNRTWRTSEHPFQAMKFYPHRRDLVDLVYAAETPSEAAKLGRNREYPIRADWDKEPSKLTLRMQAMRALIPFTDDGIQRPEGTERVFHRVKDYVMYAVCCAKFSNPELQKVLLSTGKEVLIEDTTDDTYWGWGTSKVGQNKLGRIHMAVREAIRLGRGGVQDLP